MIKVTNLNKTYDRRSPNANHVLKDVSFTLPDTGFVCILGQSGCGKTSLLNAVGGLDRFDSGSIETEQVKVTRSGTALFEAERNRSFGYIFQNYYLLSNHSVGYNVYLGLHSLKLSRREKLKRVRDALSAVDMERYIRRQVSELSGGQQQRVAIARALARRPKVIFADEPTGNLDEANTMNICTLLRKISKHSLVVMVTHEERIADFFADRIIKLDGGVVCSDSADWTRTGMKLSGGDTLYAGDYKEQRLSGEGISLRLLTAKDAKPVNLSVVALKDRIVIKLDDSRSVTCTTLAEAPVLAEGKTPTVTLQTVEQQEDIPLLSGGEDPCVRAGRGIPFGMLWREAVSLLWGRGMRQLGSWLFLLVLTVLTVLTVSDYLTVSSVDPHEFIRTDAHMLELRMERGRALDAQTLGLTELVQRYADYYTASNEDIVVVPHVHTTAKLGTEVFAQLREETISLENFSYVPLQFFDENTLILGRLPEHPNEIVVDRWVLDGVLQEDGILQNSIADITFFLDRELIYPKETYTATIVGICDSGQAAVYLELSALASIGVGGSDVMTLSQLQAMYPGEYDRIELEAGECLYIRPNEADTRTAGNTVTVNKSLQYRIVEVLDIPSYATFVVADEQLSTVIRAMLTQRFHLYCPDKAAMKDFLAQSMPMELEGMLQVEVVDAYTDSWTEYEKASTLRADARTIVTVTVMVLAMVMLFLLRRSQVQGRMDMLAVYRLLGIPKRKLVTVFTLESLLQAFVAALPCTLSVWLVLLVLRSVEDLGFAMLLPFGAALTVWIAITLYHLAVTLLPLLHLLRLPPARIASKYDF